MSIPIVLPKKLPQPRFLFGRLLNEKLVGEAIKHTEPMLLDQGFIHSGQVVKHSGQLVQHPKANRLGHGLAVDVCLDIMWRKCLNYTLCMHLQYFMLNMKT